MNLSVIILIIVSAILLYRFLPFGIQNIKQKRENRAREDDEKNAQAVADHNHQTQATHENHEARAAQENQADNPTDDSTKAPGRQLSEKEEQFIYRDLLVKTLKNLGCNIQFDETGTEIYLKYQGESFCILQNRNFIRIWDLPYFEVSLLDTNMPLIIESVIKANRNVGPSIIISEPNEKGMRDISSKMDLIFVPEIPDPEDYLSCIFKMFFNLKHDLGNQIATWNTPEAAQRPSNLTTALYNQN